MDFISHPQLEDLVAFHGHFCPGLAMGVRVAEAAVVALGAPADDEALVAVVETNNCAVDAIQFLLGCTYGKGRLIHLDHGKNVFTIARRRDGRAVRVTLKPIEGWALTPEQQTLIARVQAGHATKEERKAYDALWQARGQSLLAMPLAEILAVEVLAEYALPPAPVVEPSLLCEGCGALVMASRLVLRDGRRYCVTCAGEPVEALKVTAIGVVENDLEPASAPPRARSSHSRIRVWPQFRQGLEGLTVGQRVHVLVYLHGAEREAPVLFAEWGLGERHPTYQPLAKSGSIAPRNFFGTSLRLPFEKIYCQRQKRRLQNFLQSSLARPAGFEPATDGFEVRHSIH